MSGRLVTLCSEGTLFHDRYRIVRCLATRPQSAVYEVIDILTGARRGLEVIHPRDFVESDLRARIEAESRFAKRIDSEHMLRVYDAGIDADTNAQFFVMEFVDDDDLSEDTLQNTGKNRPYEGLPAPRRPAPLAFPAATRTLPSPSVARHEGIASKAVPTGGVRRHLLHGSVAVVAVSCLAALAMYTRPAPKAALGAPTPIPPAVVAAPPSSTPEMSPAAISPEPAAPRKAVEKTAIAATSSSAKTAPVAPPRPEKQAQDPEAQRALKTKRGRDTLY